MPRLPTINTAFLSFLWGLCLLITPQPLPAEVIELQTTPQMRQETQYVVYCMERGHYLRQPISKLDNRVFVENYISNLDFYRLFFLAPEVKSYQDRFAPTMDIFLQKGSLLPAFTVFQDFRNQMNSRIDWIHDQLDEPLDLRADDSFKPDRTKATWPATHDEADDLWRQRLRFELITEVIALDGPLTPAAETEAEADEAEEKETPLSDDEKLAKAKERVRERYDRLRKTYNEMEAVEVQEVFLNTLARMYDPHSGFLSAYHLEEFDIAMRNSLVGIGALLSDEDGYCTIKELIAGGPAQKSRLLQPGDKIVGVAQGEGEMVDVIGMKLRKVVRLIRGDQGSEVRLLIQPAEGDPSERRVITLVRDEIKLTTNLASAEIFTVPVGDETVAIGVIDLPTFYGSTNLDGRDFSTTRDVEELIGKLKEAGVQGLILDLRRNGGGFLSEAISLTGLFIPGGPVLQVRDANGQVDLFQDKTSKVAWDGPLIILVSRLSASATEIVAGALQDHKRAIVVGDSSTHGKGTVQAVYNLQAFDRRQKGAAKVTIQKWYLPNGDSIQVKGIASDIVIPSTLDLLPIGESHQDNALVWDSIPALPTDATRRYTWNKAPINDFLLETLRRNSQARQETLEEFSYLNDRMEWERNRQEQKAFPLNLDLRRAQRQKDNAFREELKTWAESMRDEQFMAKPILLNASLLQEEENRQAKVESAAKSRARDALIEEYSPKETAVPTAPAPVPQANEAVPDEDVLLVDAEEAAPGVDIHLREGLRIMADWIFLSEEKENQEQKPSVITARKAE